MTEFFLEVVNMSISASWIILAVLLFRFLLKKAPKWINVMLWGIVAVRLICPFSFESVLSLIPSPQTINPEIALNSPVIDSGVTIIDNVINPIISEATISIQPEKDINFFQFIMPYLAGVWLVGIAALLIYTLVSFLRLKRKIGTAVLLRDNIYQSESVVSPFVLGIIKPKIYLPFNMNEQDMEHVIAHEQAHIRRKDYLWKPLGFLILSLHWFNPLVWVGYILLCRDIELACDEKVVKELDNIQRADYSEALLTCSVNRKMIAACPLAFGEVGVKNRVKSVLNYKKPAFWIIIVAVIVSITVAVCFLTNPLNSSVYNSRYETGKCLYSYVVSADKETKSNELVFDITSDGKVYKTFDDGTTEELGVLKESDYTAGDLEAAIKNQDAKLNIGNIKNAYELSDCIFLQKSNGTVYLVQFFSDGRIMSVFKLNRIDASDIPNGSYKLSEEIYFNGSYSYVPDYENNRIEIKTNGGMHIYHFTGEVLSTGALYEDVKLNQENISSLLGGMAEWSLNEALKDLLKNNKEAWYHKAVDEIGGYPYMLLSQKDGTLYMVFADFKNGEPVSLRYVYKLEYMGSSENISEADSISVEKLKEKYPQFFNVSTDGGLTVYVWQQAEDDYRCYLVNTFTEAISDNSFAYETGATIPEMRTILTTYDISKENISIHPVRNPLSSYYYTIDDEYRETIKNLFWAHIIEVEPTTEEESTVQLGIPPKGSFENPYNVGDSARIKHSDIHQKDVVYDYNASITRILTGTEAEERLKQLSSNYEEEKEALESFDLYLTRVHIKYNEESTVKDRLPTELGVTAVRFDKQLQFIDPRFCIPDNVFKASDGEFYFWVPVLAEKNVSTPWLSITVGTYQGAPGIISGVCFNIPKEEKPVENTVEFSGFTYIRRCGDEYSEENLGHGTIHLPEYPDSLKLKAYGIVFCDEEWDERTIIDVAIQGWARAYHMESDGELEGNHKILKFKMAIPEQMIEVLTKRPGQYEEILADLARNYYYLIPLDETHYGYFHFEGDNEELADSIVKNAQITINLLTEEQL